MGKNTYRYIDTPYDLFNEIMGNPQPIPLIMTTLLYDSRGCIIHKNISRIIKKRRKEAYLKYCEKKKHYLENRDKINSKRRKLQINRINNTKKRYRVNGSFVSKEEQNILEKISNDKTKANEFIEKIKRNRKLKKI